MSDRTPAEVFHPGKLIEDEMEARGLSNVDVVGKAHLEFLPLLELLEGTTPVTPDIAWQLERVFDIPAQTWLNMQAAYDKGQPGPCASCGGSGIAEEKP